MRLNDIGQALIISYEKFSPIPYRCQGNKLTIGLGSTFNPTTGDPIKDTDRITFVEAFQWFRLHISDIEKFLAGLALDHLNDYQWAALVSLVYNWGPVRFGSSKLLGAIRLGLRSEIEKNWLNINKTTNKKGIKVVSNGLTERRKIEWSLYTHEFVQ